MARLEVSLLGTMAVKRDGMPATGFRTESARALLAYLIMAPYREHPRSVLAALLWPERSERTARGNLSTALAYLRQAIGDDDPKTPFVLASRDAIWINRESDHWLDVAAFRQLVEAGDIDSLERAVELYRGDLLTGLRVANSAEFEEWLVLERDRLQREILAALAELTQAHEARGDLGRACECARRALELAPWLENAHRQVMRLLALSGNRAAALSQYETCARMLMAELGVAPAPETKSLYEAIRDGEIAGPSARERRRGNLPVPLTPLVGRETELAEIASQLADPACRLLTILGPGGIGKTHLALEAGRQVLDAFAHGVAFVRLGPLASHDAIESAMAQAIGVPVGGSDVEGAPSSTHEALTAYLREKTMLLVLDEFERFVDSAASLADILGAAPETKMLVTTRVRLGLPGESVCRLRGLRCSTDEESDGPAQCVPAASLFLQAVKRARPGYAPDSRDLAAIGRICRRVEGSPLALLLAAAWGDALSMDQIADNLDGVGHALDFLATERMPGEERHASMRAVFEGSYRLLGSDLRRILSRLACLAGPFSPNAARAVSGATLHDLMSLLNRSLIHRAGQHHYAMHTLLQGFCREKLARNPAEERAVRKRHAVYYAHVVGSWGHDLRGPRQAPALDEMTAEYENVRAAWRLAAEQGRLEWLDRFSDGLAIYCDTLCHYGDQEELFRVAANRLGGLLEGGEIRDGAGWRILCRLRTWRAMALLRLCRRDEARDEVQQAAECLERATDLGQGAQRERALVLWVKANAANEMQAEDVRAILAESLGLAEEVGDDWLAANVLMLLGQWQSGPSGYALMERSIEIRRRLGDRRGLCIALPIAATHAIGASRLGEARHLLEESLALVQEMDHRGQAVAGWQELGQALANHGRYAESRQVFARLVEVCTDLGYEDLAAWCESQLGSMDLHLGDYTSARAHLVRGLARGGDAAGHSRFALMWLGLAEGDPVEARRWIHEWIASGSDQGVERRPALELAMLAIIEGDLVQARHLCLQMLRAWQAHAPEQRSSSLATLVVGAVLLAKAGRAESAVELYALASLHPRLVAAPMNHDLYGRHVEAAAASLPPEVVRAAQERGRALDVEATMDALGVELDELRF